MTPEQKSCLAYTVAHFQELARTNRYPENNLVEHDRGRCVICRPDIVPMDPFVVYLAVVTESVKARRPSVDESFVELLNNDLALMGETASITAEGLLEGDEAAVSFWREWVRDSIATGLGLVAIHCPECRQFDLDEAEEEGMGDLIEEKIKEVMDYQKENACRRGSDDT